jgi:hypothetical protein
MHIYLFCNSIYNIIKLIKLFNSITRWPDCWQL